jgi:enoyl-CoA hydratase/carnithine racemase
MTDVTRSRGITASRPTPVDLPVNRNALSLAMLDQLAHHLRVAEAGSSVRVIVLTGGRTTFGLGADRTSMLSDHGQRYRQIASALALLTLV